jgi:acyl CoA:acetate/3-ketoacid CoA transferase beta subunit
VTSLVANLIPKGIAILQYADDTILCLDEEEDKARNVKLLLYMFEQMAGLKINFEKK